MPRRPKTPPSPFNGTSLSQWQSSDALVSWAKSSPEFSAAIAVLQNEQLTRSLTLPNARADASLIQTGRMMGWGEAIGVLLALRQYPAKAEAVESVTYGVDPNRMENIEDNEPVSD